MIADIINYTLNSLVMNILRILFLFPPIECRQSFLQYHFQFFGRINCVGIHIVFIYVFKPNINHFVHRHVNCIFPVFQTVVTERIAFRTI